MVLTIATPDYARRWRFCIDSQHVYCSKQGYEHRVLDPTNGLPHPKWAKLEAAAQLLENGTDVLLLDADAEIAPECPPFTQVLAASPSRDVLFVRGISGRPNSGVLILRGGRSSAAAFLRECLARRSEPVPSEDFVTAEGENGHVIWLLKSPRYAVRSRELDPVWNCSDPAYAHRAFIRHYTNRLRCWLDKAATGE